METFTASQDYPEHDYNSIPGPCRMDWCVRDADGTPIAVIPEQASPEEAEALAKRIAHCLTLVASL